jgi:hypothetical protein
MTGALFVKSPGGGLVEVVFTLALHFLCLGDGFFLEVLIHSSPRSKPGEGSAFRMATKFSIPK